MDVVVLPPEPGATGAGSGRSSTATENPEKNSGTFIWTRDKIDKCFGDQYAALDDQAILDQLRAAPERHLQLLDILHELGLLVQEPPSNRREPYQQVMVLIVFFNTLGRQPDQSIKIVADAFRSYNYLVFWHELTATTPTDGFIMTLLVLREHIGNDTLLIIYYFGHGDLVGVPAESLLLSGNGPCPLASDATIRWEKIYPRILSIACDVLTILDCCHSGAAALTPWHIAAVNAVLRVDTAFSKEVIATAGFQTAAWSNTQHSLPPLLGQVLATYRLTGNLDSSTFFNEISFRMKSFYPPPASLLSSIVPGSRKRKRSWEEPRATNPVRYVLVEGNSGRIALRPLAPPLPDDFSHDALASRIIAGFSLPVPQFAQDV